MKINKCFFMSREISFRVVMTKRTTDLLKANYFDF